MAYSSPTSKRTSPYSSAQARWDDAERIFSIIFPTIVVVVLTSLFFIIFTSTNFEGLSSLIFPILPVLIAFFGFLFLRRATSTFFNSFYKPTEGTNASKLILRRLVGVPSAPIPLNSMFHYPFAIINIANVDDRIFILENESIHWLGGPTTLIIYDGTGVYLERGNQFSRTLGPGFAFLERYERVRDIVDLRPQTMRSGQEGKDFPRPISGRTKDGIKIEFNIEIKFHILRPDSRDTDQFNSEIKFHELETQEEFKIPKPIYAGDLEAIRKAVERTAVRRRGSEYSEVKWREGVWWMVAGNLAKYVSQHYLDELLFFENTVDENPYAGTPTGIETTSKAGQLLSSTVLETIRKELDSVLQINFGVTLSNLSITELNIPAEVNEQYQRLFAAEKQILIKRMEGINNADTIRIMEVGRAQAQKDLIAEIADAFKDIDDRNFTDSVLLSLSSILDRSLEETTIPSIMAKENLATLQQLRDFLSNKQEEADFSSDQETDAESATGDKSQVTAKAPPTPPENNQDSRTDLDDKNFRVSISFPLLLSKRIDSVFLFQLYVHEDRSLLNRNIKEQFHEQLGSKYTNHSKVKIGQKIQVEFYNAQFDFSKPVTKLIDGSLTEITFTGTPKDNCQPGIRIIRASVTDVEKQQEIDSFNIEVRVVDFVFDHVSRPLLSRASAFVLGISSFAMFILTFLEQVDKTVGLTSGTAALVLAMGIASFYNSYQRIRPNPP